VFDEGLAGLIVRKDETAANTDATIKAAKILKICTFKVRPEKRGVKLGELLLKKVFWFAQANNYDLAYITTYKNQAALIDLLEYYGFKNTATKSDGELIYEKAFGREALAPVVGVSNFEHDRLNYPRFGRGRESAPSPSLSRRITTIRSIRTCGTRHSPTCSRRSASAVGPSVPATPSARSIFAVRSPGLGRRVRCWCSTKESRKARPPRL
jgi:hypothetical protein